MCQSGYALQDELVGGICVDAGSLTCGSGSIFDNSPECSACADGFTVKDFECGKMCYSCGDVDAGTYIPAAQCLIPAAGANATGNDAAQKFCPSGICYAAFSGGNVAAGCAPGPAALAVCAATAASGETCATANGVSVCSQCCTSDLCNSFVQNLDGIPDSASMVAFNMLLITIAAFFALF